MAARFLRSELFPEELKAALMQKAEGVPLFVEEVTKTLLDLGFITRENGNYRMAKALGELAIPETIQGIIMARLDRLGRAASGRYNSPRLSAGSSLSACLSELPASAVNLRAYCMS